MVARQIPDPDILKVASSILVSLTASFGLFFFPAFAYASVHPLYFLVVTLQ